jgi:hypothetical protein
MDNRYINDDEFIKAYSRKNKGEQRSERYVKGKDNFKTIKIAYWIFLAIVFLLVYYIFAEYYFTPLY